MLTLPGRWAFMLRTGWSLVRLTVRGPASVWMVRSVSVTSIVTVLPAWVRPSATFCPTTMTTPEFDARRERAPVRLLVVVAGRLGGHLAVG